MEVRSNQERKQLDTPARKIVRFIIMAQGSVGYGEVVLFLFGWFDTTEQVAADVVMFPSPSVLAVVENDASREGS
jgi:hypothetical protein